MPAQQSKFVLDLSKALIVLSLREGDTLTRLTRVSVHDSQLVQKLRAIRISAQESGPHTAEVQLPASEVQVQFLEISDAHPDPAQEIQNLLLEEDPEGIQFITQKDDFLVGASVSQDILKQASEFATAVGLTPSVFTCPELQLDLGIVPEFFWSEPLAKRNFWPLGLAAAAVLAVGITGAFWQKSEPLNNAAFSVAAPLTPVVPTAPPEQVKTETKPDYKIWTASVRTEPKAQPKLNLNSASAQAKAKDIREIAKSRANLIPSILDLYAPTAPYRVAQALSGSVSDQTKILNIQPKLRPFTLGAPTSVTLQKKRPKLRPGPVVAVETNAPQETLQTGATPKIVELPDIATSEPDANPEPTPQVTEQLPPVEAPVVAEVSEAPSSETPVAPEPQVSEPEPVAEVGVLPEIAAPLPETNAPKPRLRPADLQSTVTAAIETANKPISHPDHQGFAPKLRPASVQALAKIAAQALRDQEAERIADEQRRTDELLAIAKAEEAERIKREQEAAIAQEIERNKPKPKAYAYPDLRPRNFARTVSRIKSIEKARLASVPKSTTKPKSTTSASVEGTSTEKARIKNSSLTLIGISGSTKSRKAIVKLRGGGYKTVKKGQTVGGWRISAIGESSVRIRKGGRDQVLRMPR